MSKTAKIIKYELYDVIRNKWLIIYTLFFLVITDSLFRFAGSGEKVIVSFMNIMLFIIPLVSIIFGTIYIYNSREFIELLLSQPINRKMLFAGMYLGLAMPMAGGFLFGVIVPFMLHDDGSNMQLLLYLLFAGTLLTFIFIAIAFFISVKFEDKARGFGMAIVAWLLFAVIYDGIVLLISFAFADYPLDKPMIAMSVLNPIDMARILMLLKTDFSALMGYTGAVFHKFFGSSAGIFVSIFSLLIWMATPLFLGYRSFSKKDF